MRIFQSLILSLPLYASSAFSADSILTVNDEVQLLDSLQASCDEGSWCESDFRFQFEQIKCAGKGSCKLTVNFVWNQVISTVGHDDTSDISVKRSCVIYGVKSREDLLKDGHHTEALEKTAGLCLQKHDPYARAEVGRVNAEFILDKCSTAEVKSAGSRILKKGGWNKTKVRHQLEALSRKVKPNGDVLKYTFAENYGNSFAATEGCDALIKELFIGPFKAASMSVTNDHDEQGRVTLVRWVPNAKVVPVTFEVYFFEAFAN